MGKKLGFRVCLGMFLSCMIVTAGYGVKDQITVSCYLGDPSDNRWVGEVKIFDVNKGRGNCNALYDRCEGGLTHVTGMRMGKRSALTHPATHTFSGNRNFFSSLTSITCFSL